MRAQYKISIIPLPDMKVPLNLPVEKIMAHTLRGNLNNKCGPCHGVLWLTSEAAYSRIKTIVDKKAGLFSNTHYVAPVKNVTYGGNIIVSGLLMVDDFIEAGKQAIGRWPDSELILVPKMPFDDLFRDLKKTPAYKIAEELKKYVWLVHDNGDFDSLLDRLFLKR